MVFTRHPELLNINPAAYLRVVAWRFYDRNRDSLVHPGWRSPSSEDKKNPSGDGLEGGDARKKKADIRESRVTRKKSS